MDSPLHERLRAVVGARTYKAIGDMTGTNAETVRRYMQGQSPSVEFLSELASAFQVSGEWLLCGRGPMRREEVKAAALREATGAELLSALVSSVEKLTSRMDRLEVYIQTVDARLRGREPCAGQGRAERSHEQEADEAGPVTKAPAPAATRRRAQRVADAIADGPAPHAG